MNGKEQKERQTAVAKLERDFKKLEESVTEAYAVEVDARMKAMEHLKELVASMINDETTWRKENIRLATICAQRYTDTVASRIADVFRLVLNMPWYQRWAFCIFGPWVLKYVLPLPLDPQQASASEPVPCSPEQSMKQAASVAGKP